MKFTRIKKTIAMGLAAMTAVSALAVPVMAADETEQTDVMTMSAEETRSRGFEIINGDVYDLNGKLLIDLTDGMTNDGFSLDPNFRVHSESEYMDDKNDIMLLSLNNPIFEGTISLNLNTTGDQGKQVGVSQKATASDNICYMRYVSGIPSGVNFSVINNTRGTMVDWFSNVKAGNYVTTTVYNSSHPNDYYSVYASAEGARGNASLRIYLY